MSAAERLAALDDLPARDLLAFTEGTLRALVEIMNKETMLLRASTQSDHTDHHRKSQANLMNDGAPEDSSSGRQHADENRSPNTMHQTQPGQSHRNPVEPVRRSGLERHLRRI